mgnify:CR=1 FL=1
MKIKQITYLLVLVGLITISKLNVTIATHTTILQFLPKEKYLQQENFTLTVYISNVTNLNVWQVTIKFDPSHLKCNNVTIPPDNLFAGYPIISPDAKIDNANGIIVKFTALDGKQGINGSGKLVEIEFEALSFTCQTDISFIGINQVNPVNGTYLQDPNGQLIDFQPLSAQIHILPPANIFTITKDSNQYNITVFTNSTTVNAFNYNETAKRIGFNLTGSQNMLSFTCVQIPKAVLNTSYYVVKVDSIPLPATIIQNLTQALICVTFVHNETETRITIVQTGAGDINGDQKVDIRDIAITAYAFGSYPGHSRWDPLADINGDGRVNIRDIAFVAYNYGNTY